MRARVLDGVPARELKSVADQIKADIGSGVVSVVGTDEGKASIVVAVTEDLVERFDAVSLVRLGSAALGGKGVAAGAGIWRRPVAPIPPKRRRPTRRSRPR